MGSGRSFGPSNRGTLIPPFNIQTVLPSVPAMPLDSAIQALSINTIVSTLVQVRALQKVPGCDAPEPVARKNPGNLID